jgi:glycosyltransferase involved in cell wall biosynthesis
VDVAVIICTHKRAALLAGAVQSVIEQICFQDVYEVIIVDNDTTPNSDIRKIVKNAGEKIPIQYVHEGKIGLSYARNAGGMRASADYLCYIDDDARLSSKYLETLLEVLKVHMPDICGGPYYPFYLDRKPVWFIDKYGSSSLGDNAKYLNQKEFLNGGNIVFKRSLLCELGWFNTSLGMLGSKIWYGEETRLMIDAWNANPNLKVYYEPNLYVYHLVPAWKMRIFNIMRISFQMGKAQVYFWIPESEHSIARQDAPFSLILGLAYLIFKLFQGIFFRSHCRYPFLQNYIVEEVAKSVSSLGSQFRLFKDLLLFSKSVK